jgi:methylenetetrahydrofolate dehydrogenase (NADP+)/methenyltetrahydrofolate cyclohydrolase
VDGILGTNKNLEAVTPKAILSILDHYNIKIKGKKILVIGNGLLVGKPLS